MYSVTTNEMFFKVTFMQTHIPGKENAFYHFEVLHEHVSFWLLAQASHTVCDAQLNGTFQSR